MNIRRITIYLLASLSLVGCGVQSIPESKNQVESTLAEVTNQYKRRADLIPNLVEVVKGYAKHEKETLEAVVQARAQATNVTIDPSKTTPETLKKYQEAQSGVSSALGRLMVVVEKYPDLKADRNFQELQAQLEGTENRTTVARQRHIEAIQNFNNQVTVPPTSWTNSIFYKHEKMAQWTVEDAKTIQEAPKVKF